MAQSRLLMLSALALLTICKTDAWVASPVSTRSSLSVVAKSNNVAKLSTTTTAASSTQLHMMSIQPVLKFTHAAPTTSARVKTVLKITGLVVLLTTALVKLVLDKPSRTYADSTTVAQEYDAWADDGILEYYWGEHIHLGHYMDNNINNNKLVRKNFIQAKYDFIDAMMKFGNIDSKKCSSAKVLDVGCGFGGTSRYLAKKLGPSCQVTGITLSPKQVERGTQLAREQGVANNTHFTVMNALGMDYDDDTFDIVWACESGEHMPDKQKYISEMMRVLKPGGTFVMACWSQRDETKNNPFTKRDKRDLQYLYEEWSHPYFISINDYKKLIDDTGVMNQVTTANWVKETLKSWRHSIWVGVVDPRGWLGKPGKYLKIFRDAYCIERMHRAFKRGLMEYGMWTATKKQTDNDK